MAVEQLAIIENFEIIWEAVWTQSWSFPQRNQLQEGNTKYIVFFATLSILLIKNNFHKFEAAGNIFEINRTIYSNSKRSV